MWVGIYNLYTLYIAEKTPIGGLSEGGSRKNRFVLRGVFVLEKRVIEEEIT